MKKPERLIGFVEYDNTEIAFEFDEEQFVLNLYPDRELWKKYARPSFAFGRHSYDDKKHEWIAQIRLCGKSSAGQRVIFSVQEDFSSYHGFLSYEVNWYFCCYEGMDENRISGFYVDGDVVDAFFPPRGALEEQWEYDEEGDRQRFTVSTGEGLESSCGSYQIRENVAASISVDAYASCRMGDVGQPIWANSRFRMDFSEPVGLDVLLDAITHTLCFFIYVTYRGNVQQELYQLCILNEEGLRDYRGILVFPKRGGAPETDKRVNEYLIGYRYLGERTAAIFDLLREERISIQHTCENHEAKRSYPISRVIMILAAFERAFESFYGKDVKRSGEYLATKEKVVALIEEYRKVSCGKEKKYAKVLRDYVDNRDSGYADNVAHALLDCREIMEPFVLLRYDGKYEVIAKNLSDRIGAVRNGVAHCRLDFKLEPIHLTDLHIVQELLYAMALKYVGISGQQCKEAIGKLFRESRIR